MGELGLARGGRRLSLPISNSWRFHCHCQGGAAVKNGPACSVPKQLEALASATSAPQPKCCTPSPPNPLRPCTIKCAGHSPRKIASDWSGGQIEN